MEKFICFLFILFQAFGIFAQCDGEPTLSATGKVLKELKISNQPTESRDYLITLKAKVSGASWQKANAEAAVLTVFVDGKYNQDIILFAGDETFEYQAILGKLSEGIHRIQIVRNEARSAPNAKNVKIQIVSIIPFANLFNYSKQGLFPSYIATINAPFINLRPDTIDKFSDIPLLTYYEIFEEPDKIWRIRYTTIFTNEDGGTQSAALMARWGRMTDIEWIYEIRVRENGEILSEIIQGANHETKNFKGQRFGSHPLLFDSTVNNNFADAGCSALRVSPKLIQANLTNSSRETVMDANPWTYRIMAEEAIREGRVNPAKLGANTIADPRDYLYLEIKTEPENAAVSVEIENGKEKSLSDFGDRRLRIERPGFVRIAVRKPVEMTKNLPGTVNIICSAISSGKTGNCRNLELRKIVWLDGNYLPREKRLSADARNIKTGEKAIFIIQ